MERGEVFIIIYYDNLGIKWCRLIEAWAFPKRHVIHSATAPKIEGLAEHADEWQLTATTAQAEKQD